MLISTNFDSFAIKYVIQVDCFKFLIFQQRLCLILAKTRGPGTSFQDAVFVNFFMKLYLLKYDINWSNFINRLCLLPKIFSKMYFLFYAQAFDDAMKFENLKY